jgi:hypothetical protein
VEQQGAYLLDYIFLDDPDAFAVVLKPVVLVAEVGEVPGVDLRAFYGGGCDELIGLSVEVHFLHFEVDVLAVDTLVVLLLLDQPVEHHLS